MHLLGLFLFPFFGFGWLMYLLPTLIAALRGKRSILGIFLVNFFLGWTVIGWVVCFVWALRSDQVVYVRYTT